MELNLHLWEIGTLDDVTMFQPVVIPLKFKVALHCMNKISSAISIIGCSVPHPTRRPSNPIHPSTYL